MSPWRQRALEVLTDGSWQDYEVVRREVGKIVPPGVALRRNEKIRAAATRLRRGRGEGVANDGGRTVQRSQQYLIDSGRRRLALEALQSEAFEIKREDGKRWVRLKPHLASVASPPSSSTATRSTRSRQCSWERATA